MPENPSEIDQPTKACLDETDWPAVFPGVLKYAEARAKMLRWMGVDADAEDLVQEAITLIYNGERRWDRDKCPDISKLIIGIIRGRTHHAAMHHQKFPKVPLHNDDGALKDIEIQKTPHDILGQSNPLTPEQDLFMKEGYCELTDSLKEMGNSDEELGMVIYCLEEGVRKPREISEITGYDIKKVNNLLRKIRRKLDQYNPYKNRMLSSKGAN